MYYVLYNYSNTTIRYYGKRCYESPDLKHLAKQYSRCFLGIISKSLNLSKTVGKRV